MVPFHEQKSISTDITFQADTIDIHFLHPQLVRMTENIAFQLRKQNKLTGYVTVKLRYSNFETFTRQVTIAYTNADHVLYKIAQELIDKLFERRMPIRMIGIRFTNLIPRNHQISLFENTQEMIKLYQSIDGIKHRYGEKLLVRANGALVQNHHRANAGKSSYTCCATGS